MQVRNTQGIFCLPLTLNNVHSVTSNAVAEAIGFVSEEKASGTYFGSQRYHKTYTFSSRNLTANTVVTIDSDFEILYNKVVKAEGFVVNAEVWASLAEVFILSNKTLAIKSTLGGTGFVVVIDLYYVK